MANNRLSIRNTLTGEEICIAHSELGNIGDEKWVVGNSLTRESLQAFYDRVDYMDEPCELNVLVGGNQKSVLKIVTEQNEE